MMSQPKSNNKRILATDLDGTLIPLTGNQANEADLTTLSKLIRDRQVTLVFVTGRHLESVETAIGEHDLPKPDWIICDVGTSIFQKSNRGWLTVADYQTLLSELLGRPSFQEFHSKFSHSMLFRLQEVEKQGDFKMSFYTDATQLDAAKALLSDELSKLGLTGTIIASVDPFNGDGLLDVLPHGVSKAFALGWWINHQNHNPDAVVFAGDSGNDLAALTAGYHTIVVGNADPSLIDSVRETHRQNGWTERLHVAGQLATSGLLEGVRAFKDL